MENVVIFALFALGIVLIVKGGDIFVDAAAWMARVTGMPKFLIGATVVSVATTLPELIVSLIAALGGKNDMAVGNAVGSVTVNVGFIMALSLLFMPGKIKRKNFSFKAVLMCLSVVALYLLCLSGSMQIYGAIIMLCLFAVFLWENIYSAKNSISDDSDNEEEKPKVTRKDLITNIIKFILGTAGIVWGADLLVDNGSAIAKLFGVPESIIGVTVIAIGTSLPELVTAITAIAKKQYGLSVGNIIGANIIDLTVILPACALASGKPLPVSAQSLSLDLPACITVIGIAVIPTLITSKLQRWQGIVLIAAYLVYMALLLI